MVFCFDHPLLLIPKSGRALWDRAREVSEMKKIREHVRGDLPCFRGRLVAVDHLPMALKELLESRYGNLRKGWEEGIMKTAGSGGAGGGRVRL